MENIEGTGGQCLFDKASQNFRGDIIEIGFENGDNIGFPIMGGTGRSFAEDGPQNIGASFVFTGPESEADTGRSEIAHRAELFDQFRQQGCAGRCDQFIGFITLSERDGAPREDLQGGRSRNGKTTVSAIDPASTFHRSSGEDARLAKEFQSDARADDIHNGIHCADFMEVNIFGRVSMDFAFGDGDAMEDGGGFFFDPGREMALGDQFFYVGKISAMLMVVFVFVLMAMIVVMMVVPVFVIVFMVLVAMIVMVMIVGQVNIELCPGNVRTLGASGVEVVTGDTEFFQFVFQLMKIHAEVEQCANKHVATDAAENIEINCFHFNARSPAAVVD